MDLSAARTNLGCSLSFDDAAVDAYEYLLGNHLWTNLNVGRPGTPGDTIYRKILASSFVGRLASKQKDQYNFIEASFVFSKDGSFAIVPTLTTRSEHNPNVRGGWNSYAEKSFIKLKEIFPETREDTAENIETRRKIVAILWQGTTLSDAIVLLRYALRRTTYLDSTTPGGVFAAYGGFADSLSLYWGNVFTWPKEVKRKEVDASFDPYAVLESIRAPGDPSINEKFEMNFDPVSAALIISPKP